MHQLDTRNNISVREQQHSTGSGYPERQLERRPERFSSLSKTKPRLTWSRAAQSTALRLPKASFNQHFYAFTEPVGLLDFSFMPCHPLPPKVEISESTWLLFFSHLGNNWDQYGLSEMIQAKMSCNSKLCAKKHSGTSPKMHLNIRAAASNLEKKAHTNK